MTEEREIAEALDECANRIVAGDVDPYEAICDACARLSTGALLGSDAWLVLIWIEDLLEDIRGPFSHAVSNAAARTFAREWLTLADRHDERTQSEFLSRWVRDFSTIVDGLPAPTQADRFERDASILSVIGNNGMRSATRSGQVELPADLVDLAVQAAARHEDVPDAQESAEARLDREREGHLATIGRLALEHGRRDGDSIIVTLPADVIRASLAAANPCA